MHKEEKWFPLRFSATEPPLPPPNQGLLRAAPGLLQLLTLWSLLPSGASDACFSPTEMSRPELGG